MVRGLVESEPDKEHGRTIPLTDIHAAEGILSCVTIELVLLPASVVLGIVHIIIMSHLQARKGLAIGRVGVIAGSGSLRTRPRKTSNLVGWKTSSWRYAAHGAKGNRHHRI